MRERDFVQKLWVENMGLAQGKVMVVIVGGPIYGALRGQRAPAKLIHKILAKDICREAQPVFGAEIVVDATVISIFRVSLRIREGEAPHRIRYPVSPIVRASTSNAEGVSTSRTFLVGRKWGIC